MFSEMIKVAKGMGEYNHIQAIHIFVANKDESVEFVHVFNNQGMMSTFTREYYENTLKRKVIEGRIRSLGVRIIFQDEDSERHWEKDIFFHKGIVYETNK